MSSRLTGLRYLAAALAAAAGLIYLLIAVGVLEVVSTPAQSGDGLIPAVAGAAFLLVAIALALTASRAVEVAGVVIALVAIVGYFVVAPNRTPQFEAWGITVKFIQAAQLIVLGYLALHRRAALPSRA